MGKKTSFLTTSILLLVVRTMTVAGTCPVCFDSSQPKYPNNIVAQFGYLYKCLEAHSYWPNFSDGDNDPECKRMQLEIRDDCGCPVDPSNTGTDCRICNGEYYDPNANVVVAEGGGLEFGDGSTNTMTCQEIEDRINADFAMLPRCSDYQDEYYEACCMCKLCDEPLADTHGKCADIESSARHADTVEACRSFQETAGVYCGCREEDEGSLPHISRLCEEKLVDPFRWAGEGMDCWEVEQLANQQDRLEYYRNNYAERCCAGPCKLCPLGIYNPEELEYCHDLEDNYRILGYTAADPLCEERQQLWNTKCCADGSSEVNTGVCFLCEDGSQPTHMYPSPFEERVPNSSFWESCAQLQNNALQNPSECVMHQAMGPYCGCTNPVASANACRICGENAALPDPGRFIARSFFRSTTDPTIDSSITSCGQAELISNKESSICETFQDTFASVCCPKPCILCGGIFSVTNNMDDELANVCEAQYQALIWGGNHRWRRLLHHPQERVGATLLS
mmetsp:Transcript_17974/g.34251  ORF Transcript_17974/g.34251 Transcript_17974/m.34251 type:complete len:508 (-) Transcript_17974:251-1774(-)